MGVLGEKNYNSFICINQIRNKFSHKFGYSLTQKDLQDLKKIYNPAKSDILNKHKDQNLSNKILLLCTVAAHFQGKLEYLAEVSMTLNPLSTISIKRFKEEYEKNALKEVAQDTVKPKSKK